MTETEITHPSQIDPEYKRRYLKRCAELGKDRLSFDESWPISQWAKGQYSKFVEARKKIEQKDKQEEARIERAIREGKPIIAPQDRTCRDCGSPLTKKPGRGRWPVRCEPCKNK